MTIQRASRAPSLVAGGLAASGLALAAAAAAPPRPATDPMLVRNPAQLEWKPKEALPPGAFGALLGGTLERGPFTFLGRFPARYRVPMHHHSEDVWVVMLEDSMIIGRDGQPDVTVEEGGFLFLPARLPYTASCPDGCVFLVHGERGFDIVYRDGKDDPRRAK